MKLNNRSMRTKLIHNDVHNKILLPKLNLNRSINEDRKIKNIKTIMVKRLKDKLKERDKMIEEYKAERGTIT